MKPDEQPSSFLQMRPATAVRPMRVEDVAGVVALAAGEPTAPHWPVAEYRRMLEVIARSPSRRGAWVLLAESRAKVGARVEAKVEAGLEAKLEPLGPLKTRAVRAGSAVVGFAMASHVAGICELEAVVVDPAWRGRRLGAVLVEAAAAWAGALGSLRLELEVRASNTAALRLYQRMGFSIDGTRPNYYSNPDEEAVLMSLPLQSPEPTKIA